MATVPARKWATAAITIIAMIAAVMILAWVPACQPYAAAWRTLDGVQRAQDLTAQQLATVARAKHSACIKAHAAKTPEYATCIKDTREMIRVWQQDVRPGVIAAVQVTATSLQIAEKVKSDKKVDWMTLLKPAVCALLRVARAYGHYYPDSGKTILVALSAIEGVACE